MSTTAVIVIVVAALVVLAIVAFALTRRNRLRDLDPESRTRFAADWRGIETRFIDNPREAVAEADRLAVTVLEQRGLRMDDTRRHPSELREARDAAASHEEGTEGLRLAMVRYQAIIDDAVGEDTRTEAERGRTEVA